MIILILVLIVRWHVGKACRELRRVKVLHALGAMLTVMRLLARFIAMVSSTTQHYTLRSGDGVLAVAVSDESRYKACLNMLSTPVLK